MPGEESATNICYKEVVLFRLSLFTRFLGVRIALQREQIIYNFNKILLITNSVFCLENFVITRKVELKSNKKILFGHNAHEARQKEIQTSPDGANASHLHTRQQCINTLSINTMHSFPIIGVRNTQAYIQNISLYITIMVIWGNRDKT